VAQALLTAVGLALLGVCVTAVLGLTAGSAAVAISRHIMFGFFSTMIALFAHSMMMFYLVGKGKAVKDAMVEAKITGDYYQQIATIRKPVFSIGGVAMAMTMGAALIGASVDTGHLPPMVHAFVAYGAIACNLMAIKIEADALNASSRVVDEVNRILGS
jgi:hypothetical protein